MGRLLPKRKRITGKQRAARKRNIVVARKARQSPHSAASAKKANASMFRAIKKMKKTGLGSKEISHLLNTTSPKQLAKLGRK